MTTQNRKHLLAARIRVLPCGPECRVADPSSNVTGTLELTHWDIASVHYRHAHCPVPRVTPLTYAAAPE